MRNHAIKQIEKFAENDERIMMVCADLGYNVLNNFESKCPDRFINVGIAEQNMALVAAGLAFAGNIVFTYSIGNFPTLRCIEQIRNDICYHNANVKILSVGGGFAYGDLGMTHHATEDIAMMRALPNMRVYVPSDPNEAISCIDDAYNIEGPAYIRMAKGGEPILNEKMSKEYAGLYNLSSKSEYDVAIIGCGPVVKEAISAADMLNEKGIRASVFSCPSVKPLNEKAIKKIASEAQLIITVEEHNIIGGLGGAIAEYLAEHTHNVKFVRMGLQDTYTSIVGDCAYLRQYYGLSANSIYKKVVECLEK